MNFIFGVFWRPKYNSYLRPILDDLSNDNLHFTGSKEDHFEEGGSVKNHVHFHQTNGNWLRNPDFSFEGNL